MDQIPIRVLNQDTARVVERVERGETVEITNRGKPVARIVPVVTGELDDLVEMGWAKPPTLPRPFLVGTGPVDHENTATGALLTMREEERW